MKAPFLFPATACRRAARRGQKGYVLIFSLAVLLFVTAIVFSTVSSLRVDAQLTLREKERLQIDYLLRGGLQYLMAQFAVTRTAEQMGGALDARLKEELGLWRPGGGPYSVRLKGGTVTITLADGGILPDANLLTEAEWSRLLEALHGGKSEKIRLWVGRIMQERSNAMVRSGRAGFSSMREILEIAELPIEIRYGKNGTPGLKDLLRVGTSLKRLEINRSPLVLFGALMDVGQDQLRKLEQARQAGRLTVADAARILGPNATQVYEGTSNVVLATIAVTADAVGAPYAAPAGGVVLAATLTGERGSYRLGDQEIRPVAALAETPRQSRN